jgi:hypothetical protein
MSELFDIPESKSPRLLWIEKHGIKIIDSGIDYEDCDECEITGNQCFRYYASSGDLASGGHTKDDAIIALALKLQLRLWNEA